MYMWTPVNHKILIGDHYKNLSKHGGFILKISDFRKTYLDISWISSGDCIPHELPDTTLMIAVSSRKENCFVYHPFQYSRVRCLPCQESMNTPLYQYLVCSRWSHTDIYDGSSHCLRMRESTFVIPFAPSFTVWPSAKIFPVWSCFLKSPDIGISESTESIASEVGISLPGKSLVKRNGVAYRGLLPFGSRYI